MEQKQKNFEPKKIPETITEEELIKILNATKKPHHKFAFALGFYQAMRVSEIVKLRPEDIDYDQKIIKIKGSKGGRDRHIPIAPQVIKGLKKYIPIKCGVRALEIAFKKKAKEVLNKDLKFHTLRHSGATYYLNEKKWNIRQVQYFLGHKNIQTTQIYTHVKPSDLVALMWGEG